MSTRIEDIFWIKTWEDIIRVMNNFPLDEFDKKVEKIIFWWSEMNYLYDNNSEILLAFIDWIIIVKFSKLNKNIYPFIKHLERILINLGLTKEDFWITKYNQVEFSQYHDQSFYNSLFLISNSSFY